MPATKNAPPTDNSHFPITVKPGDRFSWWVTPWRKPLELRTSPKKMLDPITSPGHTPTLRVLEATSNYRRSLPFEISCSCGHVQPKNYYQSLGSTGKLPNSFITAWNGHTDSLAAPLLMWEAKSPRTHTECWIATDAHLPGFGLMGTGRGGSRFHIVFKRLKGAKQTNSYWSYAALKQAQTVCFNLGTKEENRGKTLTWHNSTPVAPPSGEASVVLAAMQQANDPGSILQAIKVADDYLNYAKLIESAKADLMTRLNTLILPEEDEDATA